MLTWNPRWWSGVISSYIVIVHCWCQMILLYLYIVKPICIKFERKSKVVLSFWVFKFHLKLMKNTTHFWGLFICNVLWFLFNDCLIYKLGSPPKVIVYIPDLSYIGGVILSQIWLQKKWHGEIKGGKTPAILITDFSKNIYIYIYIYKDLF